MVLKIILSAGFLMLGASMIVNAQEHPFLVRHIRTTQTVTESLTVLPAVNILPLKPQSKMNRIVPYPSAKTNSFEQLPSIPVSKRLYRPAIKPDSALQGNSLPKKPASKNYEN